jgi:hypothetical protein
MEAIFYFVSASVPAKRSVLDLVQHDGTRGPDEAADDLGRPGVEGDEEAPVCGERAR